MTNLYNKIKPYIPNIVDCSNADTYSLHESLTYREVIIPMLRFELVEKHSTWQLASGKIVEDFFNGSDLRGQQAMYFMKCSGTKVYVTLGLFDDPKEVLEAALSNASETTYTVRITRKEIQLTLKHSKCDIVVKAKK